MAATFNPYYTFLGLDEELTSPSHYQLLRLKEQETDAEKIRAAATKAATRVRGHRPGQHAPEWAKLLDEIEAAKACLLDATQRRAYDQKLGVQSASDAAPAPGRPANPAPFVPALTFVPPAEQNFAYPPVAGSANPAPAAHAPPTYNHLPATPAAPFHPAPLADPTEPVLPAMAGPMSPVAYAWTSGPAVAPHIAPNPSHHLDPMAPVAFPARHELPTEARPRIVGFAGGAMPGHDLAIPFATPVAVPMGSAAVVQVAQAVAPTSELAGLPTQGPSFKSIAKRPARLPLPLVVGGGGAIVVLAALLVAWKMSDTSEPEQNPLAVKDPTKPSVTQPIQPASESKPESRPEPSIAVQPEPEMAEPEPDPEASNVDPEPAQREVEPEPVKPDREPEPKPMPTAEELAELSQLMKDAKAALGDFNFDEADAALEQAAKVAKTPEHQAVVSRLKTVAKMAQQFRLAIVQSMTKLDAGEEIKIGNGNVMIVVESSPEKLILRRNGKNEPFTLNDMPLGLAVYLGERVLNANDANTRLLKGSYAFVDKRTDPSLAKTQTWWEEAQSKGADITELLPVLSDTYDFAAEPMPE